MHLLQQAKKAVGTAVQCPSLNPRKRRNVPYPKALRQVDLNFSTAWGFPPGETSGCPADHRFSRRMMHP